MDVLNGYRSSHGVVDEVALPEYVLAEPYRHRSSAVTACLKELHLPPPYRHHTFKASILHDLAEFRVGRYPRFDCFEAHSKVSRELRLRTLECAEFFQRFEVYLDCDRSGLRCARHAFIVPRSGGGQSNATAGGDRVEGLACVEAGGLAGELLPSADDHIAVSRLDLEADGTPLTVLCCDQCSS